MTTKKDTPSNTRLQNIEDRLNNHSDRLSHLTNANTASDGKHDLFLLTVNNVKETMQKLESTNKESMDRIEKIFQETCQTFKNEYATKHDLESYKIAAKLELENVKNEGISKARLTGIYTAVFTSVLTFAIIKLLEL